MKKLFVKISCVTLLVTAFACNNNKDNSATGSHDSKEVAEEQNEDKFESRDVRKDADFVTDQVSANFAEIELARLGTQMASNSEVKKLAQMLLTDHQKKVKELEKLAAAKAISVPSQADDKDLNKVSDLRDNGKDFDKDWCKEMMDKHDAAIDDYEDQLDNTEDPDLKTWIGNTLTDLRKHRDELKACHEKLKES